MTTKPKTNPRLVADMVKFYGTIEAAREAYRAAKGKLNPYRGGCLWVNGAGEIENVCAGDVMYVGSPDAWRVLG